MTNIIDNRIIFQSDVVIENEREWFTTNITSVTPARHERGLQQRYNDQTPPHPIANALYRLMLGLLERLLRYSEGLTLVVSRTRSH